MDIVLYIFALKRSNVLDLQSVLLECTQTSRHEVLAVIVMLGLTVMYLVVLYRDIMTITCRQATSQVYGERTHRRGIYAGQPKRSGNPIVRVAKIRVSRDCGTQKPILRKSSGSMMVEEWKLSGMVVCWRLWGGSTTREMGVGEEARLEELQGVGVVEFVESWVTLFDI